MPPVVTPQYVRSLHHALPGTATSDPTGLAHLLHLDLNTTGPVMALPPDVASMHKCGLGGPFLVQLQEIWDISLSDEQRRDRSKTPPEELPNLSKNRMLKLAMSDGVQEVVGFEYQRIHAISAEMTTRYSSSRKACATARVMLPIASSIAVIMAATV